MVIAGPARRGPFRGSVAVRGSQREYGTGWAQWNPQALLDWLVCGKGPRYYKEKLEEEKDDKEVIEEKKVIEEKEETQPVPVVKIPEGEIKELLEYMERIPFLRHEILVSFYKFKEEHKEIVKAADIDH